MIMSCIPLAWQRRCCKKQLKGQGKGRRKDGKITWVTSSKKVPSNMRKMCWFRSSCACQRYHPSLCSPFIYSVVSNDSGSRMWRPWLDCADEQADQGCHCRLLPERRAFAWPSQYNGLDWSYLTLLLHKAQLTSQTGWKQSESYQWYANDWQSKEPSDPKIIAPNISLSEAMVLDSDIFTWNGPYIHWNRHNTVHY